VSLSILQIAPLLGGTGGVGTAIGVYLSRRQIHKEQQERSWLVEDEILGHERSRGIPAKLGMSDRLGLVEIAATEVQKTVESVHHLAEQSAEHSHVLADNLANDQAATGRLADAFDAHVSDDARNFQRIIDILNHHSLSSTPDTEETDTP